MHLESIITLASRPVRLRFLAMERSLRATGCNLPLKVIPYGDEKFDLPANASWWELPELTAWLKRWQAHPMMRKYQCLLIANYQFVDADVCFLRNPATVLEPATGFITSCGHWHNPADTLSAESAGLLASRSTTWQKNIFNAGQWSCDRALFSFPELVARCEAPGFAPTCLKFPYHDQPGLNLLVNASGVVIHNLTLPPRNMQSTWAGDYPGDYRHYWRTEDETPYLIHWAGVAMDGARPINAIFLNHLTAAERAEWNSQLAAAKRQRRAAQTSLPARARRWRNAWRAFVRTLRQE
jgi:hypothetical protein